MSPVTEHSAFPGYCTLAVCVLGTENDRVVQAVWYISPMASVITRTEAERRAGGPSNLAQQGHRQTTARIADARKGPKTRQLLRAVAVLGKLEEGVPEEKNLQEYIFKVTGQYAKKIEMKRDSSFMITMSQVADALILASPKEKFQERLYIHLEKWSTQVDPNKTVFQKTLICVALPDLRDDCVELVDDILGAVGELVIRPSEEEILDRRNPPKFGVRATNLNLDMLPSRVDITMEEDEEDISQPLTYPSCKSALSAAVMPTKRRHARKFCLGRQC